MNHEEKQRHANANAGHANPDEAFERLIDSVLALPVGMVPTPDCSWCNWRRGDSPRNLKLCGHHQIIRNNLWNGMRR